MPVPSFPLAGFVPLSTCDWEGKLVSTLFSQGCPMACVFCHNPSLIDPRGIPTVEWETVRKHLVSRRGLLDGVVFSGGEPTMHLGLVDRALEVKDMGYSVGVHTAGSFPQRIQALVSQNVLDWVGFDIKAGWSRYGAVTASNVSKDKVLASLDTLLGAGVSVEIRSTVHPDFFGMEDAEDIVTLLAEKSINEWVLQPARSVDNGAQFDDVPALWLEDICQLGELSGIEVRVR